MLAVAAVRLERLELYKQRQHGGEDKSALFTRTTHQETSSPGDRHASRPAHLQALNVETLGQDGMDIEPRLWGTPARTFSVGEGVTGEMSRLSVET